MPELPDVEVYKRYLDATALKQAIAGVEVLAPALLQHTTPQGLGRHLKGAALTQTHRHGKYLFARADGDGWLVLHFGMTGRLEYRRSHARRAKGTGFVIRFENGAELAYIAPRKLGHIAWSDDPDAFVQDRKLGPDAARLDLGSFGDLAAKRRGAVKAWLMDQQVMAGIGNIYSDEILLRAGIHPGAAVQALDHHAIEGLHSALGQVLQQAIDAGADPQRMPASFLLPNRRPGAPCPRCGGKIERIRTGGRSAYFCPKCQIKP